MYQFMSDNVTKRVEELETEVAQLLSILKNMEEQLIVLYKEKDIAYTSELATLYQKDYFNKLEETK